MCFLNTHALTKTKQSEIIKGLLMIIHMLYHASVLHANIPALIGCILQQGREIPDFSSLLTCCMISKTILKWNGNVPSSNKVANILRFLWRPNYIYKTDVFHI